MIDANKLEVFEFSNGHFRQIILRYNGYDTKVTDKLYDKMVSDCRFAQRMKDKVTLYKEAIK